MSAVGSFTAISGMVPLPLAKVVATTEAAASKVPQMIVTEIIKPVRLFI
jgi:hypothetical protein